MSMGFGFTPAIINGQSFVEPAASSAQQIEQWLVYHRAGVYASSVTGGGGGGGGKNEVDTRRGQAGGSGTFLSGNYFLDYPEVVYGVGEGGIGGSGGTGFNPGSNGGSGGPSYLWINSTVVLNAPGGSGGLGTGYGSGYPDYNPFPEGNGGLGGSGMGSLGAQGGNGGNGSVVLSRIS